MWNITGCQPEELYASQWAPGSGPIWSVTLTQKYLSVHPVTTE